MTGFKSDGSERLVSAALKGRNQKILKVVALRRRQTQSGAGSWVCIPGPRSANRRRQPRQRLAGCRPPPSAALMPGTDY